MMKSVLAFACAALLSCGLQAQVMGSINRGAAKVTNTLEMGGNKLSVNYTALERELGHTNDDLYVDKWADEYEDEKA